MLPPTDTLQFTLRPAVEADAGAIALLANEVFRATYGAAFTSEESLGRYIAERLSESVVAGQIREKRSDYILAEQQGRLAGMASILERDPPACIASSAALELGRLYVRSEYHGRGVAHKLMRSTLDHAAERGADTLWLCVWDRNPRAIAFYRKWNFQEAGSKILMIDDVEFVDLLMKRRVKEA